MEHGVLFNAVACHYFPSGAMSGCCFAYGGVTQSFIQRGKKSGSAPAACLWHVDGLSFVYTLVCSITG